METWRELYDTKFREREEKMKMLAANISVNWEIVLNYNKAGYTAIRGVLAGTDSSFGQKRHFCMVSTRV